jgi:two-component system, OmpR family, phosphate regulon sensor histidine kinase PhoR
MREKIIWKFLSILVFLIILAVFILNFFVSLKLRDYYEQKITDKLKSNALLIEYILQDELLFKDSSAIQSKIQDLSDDLNLRITVVEHSGKVLGDSEKSPISMDNHSDRPEIMDAINSGFGESFRFSDTLNYRMKYVARSVKQGENDLGVIRLAISLSEVEQQMNFIYRIVSNPDHRIFYFPRHQQPHPRNKKYRPSNFKR